MSIAEAKKKSKGEAGQRVERRSTWEAEKEQGVCLPDVCLQWPQMAFGSNKGACYAQMAREGSSTSQ